VKIIHAMIKVNMDNYRCYLPARVRIFKSSGQDFFSNLVYSSGASVSLGDGDLDGCTSCVGDSDDVVIFSFHTCLVCELVLGGVVSSFKVIQCGDASDGGAC
jgi:hypothetical protein